MDGSIKLDCNLCLRAVKVRDEAGNHLLTPEM